MTTIPPSDADGKDFSFMISGLKSKNRISLVLSAESQEEATSWIKCLNKCINDQVQAVEASNSTSKVSKLLEALTEEETALYDEIAGAFGRQNDRCDKVKQNFCDMPLFQPQP